MHLVAEGDDRHEEGLQEGIAQGPPQGGSHEGGQQGGHETPCASGEPAPQVQLENQGDQALVGGPPLQVLGLQGGQGPPRRNDLCPVHNTASDTFIACNTAEPQAAAGGWGKGGGGVVWHI